MCYIVNSANVCPAPKAHLHAEGFILAVHMSMGLQPWISLAAVCIDGSCLYFPSPHAVDLQHHEKWSVALAFKGGG